MANMLAIRLIESPFPQSRVKLKLPHFRGVFDPQDDYVSAMAASIVAS